MAKVATRDRILATAEQLFAEAGIGATSLRTITAAAGVNLAAVNYHFGSKDGLREACDQHVVAAFRETKLAAMEDDNMFDPGFAADAYRMAQPLLRYFGWALARGHPAASDLFDEMLREGIEISRIAIERGMIVDSPDLETRTAVQMAMQLGMTVMHSHLDRNLGMDTLSAEGIAALTPTLLEIFSGLFTPAVLEQIEAVEGLSQPFQITVDIIAPLGELDLLPHLGKPVSLFAFCEGRWICQRLVDEARLERVGVSQGRPVLRPVLTAMQTGRGKRMILRRTQEMVSGDLSAALARQPSTENTVVSLHTQVADYTLDGERFALLAAWGGRQEVMMDSRRISVDDDTWLPVPAGPATVRVRGSDPVNVLTVLFRRGMPEEVLGALITADDRLLDDGEVHNTPALPFIPHLQTHDRGVTPVLLFFYLRHLVRSRTDLIGLLDQSELFRTPQFRSPVTQDPRSGSERFHLSVELAPPEGS